MSVREFYSGKSVFVTGGTGFLGLCLVEKLLRTIPDLGAIYLLLRPKRGKEVSERLEEISKNKVFEKLLETREPEEVFGKLKAIAGDVAQPNLGISESDRDVLTEKIEVIFHSAATLDFAESLKTTVEVNLLGTRRCLELAKECRNLKAFVHVSSAYVNAFKLCTEEVIYPLEQDPEKLIDLVSKLSEEELEKQTPELLGEHLNTYTITKHMAEHEVQKMEAAFPCTIVRPSMIVGAWREPVPGWTVSKNGPQGFLMGASKGVVRRLPVGRDLVYDYIPCDVVVNQLLAAACHAAATAKTRDSPAAAVTVFHCTSSTRQPFRWAAVEDRVNLLLHEYPLKSAVWYPHLKFLPSLARFRVSAVFVHFIPALVLDLFARVFGGKPILMRLHRNVNASLTRLEKFIFTEWTFKAEKTAALHEWLSPSDRRDFSLDLKDLYWPDYFADLTKGARVYLSKEPLKNLSAAKGKDTMLMVLHLALQAAILSVVWYIAACVLGTTMTKSALVVPIFYVLFNLL